MRKVIYTSMFGYKADSSFFLHNPSCDLEGWDLICFTDEPTMKSDVWDVRVVDRIYTDGARQNRFYKILPHKHLKEYDVSVCIDADVLINKNINNIVEEHLREHNMSVLDHSICGMSTTGNLNRRDCIYDEAAFIKWLGDNHPRKHYKDDMNIINNQMDKYKSDGYPPKNGLARTTVIFRKHNEMDVIKTMEKWWSEYQYNSRRDQLSLPYSAWKTNFEYKLMPIDIDDNQYFQYMKKWRRQKMKEVNEDYEPISLDYFLNMEIANGGESKMIIKDNGKLKKVKDVVDFFSNKENLKKVKTNLKPNNWQYFNCMMAEFRHNVANHHDLGWDKLTKDYYDSLPLMDDDEILEFNKLNCVEFDNGFIKHSYHRACAMIGRLLNGKKYIPFYMKKSQIYDNPRTHDGMHRIKPLINNIVGLLNLQIPKNEFTITQSGILSLMGIRQNDDIDIIISTEARNQMFNGNEGFIRLDGGVEIFEKNRGKFRIFNAQGDDDLIENYSFKVNGYNFLEPRFYFSRKHKDKQQRDIDDWNGIRRFFEIESHKGYPFNKLSDEQWGIEYL